MTPSKVGINKDELPKVLAPKRALLLESVIVIGYAFGLVRRGLFRASLSAWLFFLFFVF